VPKEEAALLVSTFGRNFTSRSPFPLVLQAQNSKRLVFKQLNRQECKNLMYKKRMHCQNVKIGFMRCNLSACLVKDIRVPSYTLCNVNRICLNVHCSLWVRLLFLRVTRAVRAAAVVKPTESQSFVFLYYQWHIGAKWSWARCRLPSRRGPITPR
jgi:hypothetical protein